MKLTRWMIGLLVLAVIAAATMVGLVVPGGSDGSAAAQAPARPLVQAPDAGQTSESAIPTVLVSADFGVIYSTLDELEKTAQVVVRGRVTRVSYLDFNSTAYTKTTLEVSDCLKGDVAVGQEITLAEVGGVTTMAAVVGDKFGEPTAKDLNTKVRVLLEGAPLSEVGDECLYFLGKGGIGVISGVYYVPLGAFQGRFKIRDSVAERFVPVDWTGDGKYTSLALPEDDLEQLVMRAAAEK